MHCFRVFPLIILLVGYNLSWDSGCRTGIMKSQSLRAEKGWFSTLPFHPVSQVWQSGQSAALIVQLITREKKALGPDLGFRARFDDLSENNLENKTRKLHLPSGSMYQIII